MAPPNTSLPLSQRLLALAQTLQFAWFVGHVSLLLCITRYTLSYLVLNYYSRWAQVSYRTAFVSAAATYGIVVYKNLRARLRASTRPQPSPIALVADENVQYLAMALVWLFAGQYPLAMLPFGVYSVFHVASYTRSNLIPTVCPPSAPGAASPSQSASKGAALADTIGKFVKEYYDASMGLVALLEIALWFRIAISALAFVRGSWSLLIVYTTFLRARHSQSSFVQEQARDLAARVDALAGGQNVPPPVRQAWDAAKQGVGQFHEATRLSKYLGNAPAEARKSS